MATLGHLAIGMAAARLAVPDDARPRDRALAMGLLSLVSMAPDADVLAFALHVPYHAPFGHRGAVHSLALSCALGAVAGAALGWRRFPRWRAALAAGLVAASHGLLDTLTDGGLGIALLWPFSTHRWRVESRAFEREFKTVSGVFAFGEPPFREPPTACTPNGRGAIDPSAARFRQPSCRYRG